MPSSRPSRRAWLHLLWTVPVAVGASSLPAGLAALSVCDINGNACYIGGRGFDEGGLDDAVAYCSLAGLLVTCAIAFVPWTPLWRVRIPVSVGVGLAWAGVLFASTIEMI